MKNNRVYHFTSRDRMLRQIVDRCHAGDSNKDVFKYVISRLANKWKTFKAMDVESQKRLLRAVKTIHADNKNLYRYVVEARLQ